MCLMLDRRPLPYGAHHMYSSALFAAALPAGPVAGMKSLQCYPASPCHSLWPCCKPCRAGSHGLKRSDAQEFAEARRAAACADAPRCTYIHPGVSLLPRDISWTCTKPSDLCLQSLACFDPVLMLGLAPVKRPSGASQAAQWRKSSGPAALAHLTDAGIMPCDWPACPHAPLAACLRRAATAALRAGGGSRWTLPNTLQRRRPPGPGNPAAPCGGARVRGRRGLGAAHAVRARGRAHQALQGAGRAQLQLLGLPLSGVALCCFGRTTWATLVVTPGQHAAGYMCLVKYCQVLGSHECQLTP